MVEQVVKTTEQTISLDNQDMVISLLNEKDLDRYKLNHKFIHIGLVQVAFKPLTLEGLPESFIATLRDGRNLNWKQSLMGIIQSSLAHGPVYFNVYPNLQLSLSDINILDALTLNIKMHGYNYAPGSEVICICYRIYYKPLFTLNPHCKMVNKPLNETILIETNFNRSNITTRRPIKWNEIEFPENWIIEKAVPAQNQHHQENNLAEIIQTPEGQVKIQFESSKRPIIPNRISRSQSSHFSHISPIDYIVRSPSRASTSHIREEEYQSEKVEKVNKIKINKDNIVRGIFNNDIDLTESEMNF